MRKHAMGSPVLIELILVILFFGLSATTVVRLLVAANAESVESRRIGAATVALENFTERLKADPAGGENPRTVTETADGGALLTAVITATATDGGTLYEMRMSAVDAGEVLAAWDAAQYVQSGEAGG